MPWGMDFGFPQFDPGFQDFQQDTFANQMQAPAYQAPVQQSDPFAKLFGPQNTPALDRYQQYLTDVPNRQDYQPGIMGKILAGIAGLSAGIKDPSAGVKTSMGIMDIPYQQAVQQYNLQEPGLRNAAGIEERQLNDKNVALKQLYTEQQNRSQAQALQAYQDKQLALEKARLDRQLQDDLRDDQNADATRAANERHDRASEALMSLGQQLGLLKEFNPMDIILQGMKGMQGGQNAPNSSMLNFQLQQRLISDPTFQNVMGPKGADPSKMNEIQYSRYQAILREMGITPSLDIGLGQ